MFILSNTRTTSRPGDPTLDLGSVWLISRHMCLPVSYRECRTVCIIWESDLLGGLGLLTAPGAHCLW